MGVKIKDLGFVHNELKLTPKHGLQLMVWSMDIGHFESAYFLVPQAWTIKGLVDRSL